MSTTLRESDGIELSFGPRRCRCGCAEYSGPQWHAWNPVWRCNCRCHFNQENDLQYELLAEDADMSSPFTRDPRTVEFDWQEHLKQCEECRREKNTAHYERVKWMAEKYPLTCTDCGTSLEEWVLHCYHCDADGKMCRSTKLFFRAHQGKPT